MEENPLEPGNEHALRVYARVCSPLCFDFHLSEFVLESLGYYRGLRITIRIIEKLALIHAIKHKKEEDGDAGNAGNDDGPEK